MLEKLNRQYGSNSVSFVSGAGNLPCVKINNAFASCVMALHGAHILSYIPQGGQDVLFVSDNAVYAEGKPIRGGIPICAPFFGGYPIPDKYPAHGFVRLVSWRIADVRQEGQYDVIELALDGAELPPDRNFGFDFRYTVAVGPSLRAALTVTNRTKAEVAFSAALHSYFAVGAIAETSVANLENCSCFDALDKTEKLQSGEITFDCEVDRIYQDTEAETVIHDRAGNRDIFVSKSGSCSTVVWNPWIDKSRRMADFGDKDYLKMVCVETANAGTDKRVIAPGKNHVLALEIRCNAL